MITQAASLSTPLPVLLPPLAVLRAHVTEAAGHGAAFLQAAVAAGEGIQIGYSLDPQMAPGSVMTHREVLTAPLPPEIRRRIAPFGDDLREALTSGMALKLIPDLPAALARPLVRYTLTHRHEEQGRFRFYAGQDSIAPCADMTGICLVGLWRSGAISSALLCSGAREILKAAAAESVRAEDNTSHGGRNGALQEGVLKIYWDDHADGPLQRRGRKHDAVVVCDGLHAVLLAERAGGLDLSAPVPLREHRADGSLAVGELSGAEIVRRSVGYLRACCADDRLADGTTYYGCPTFLMALIADLIADGGAHTACLRAPLHRALRRWMGLERESSALGIAGAIIAASRSDLPGIDMLAWRRALVTLQQPDGSWPAAPWYRMRTRPLFYGNAAATTVFALAALSER